jgi:hypothetical protein
LPIWETAGDREPGNRRTKGDDMARIDRAIKALRETSRRRQDEILVGWQVMRECDDCGRAVYDARAVMLVLDGRVVAQAFYCRRCADEPVGKAKAAINEYSRVGRRRHRELADDYAGFAR